VQQLPLLQTCVSVQVVTQDPDAQVWHSSAGHEAQAPDTQVWHASVGQELSQKPQFSGSVWRSVHSPPQQVWPGAQHPPEQQTAPPKQHSPLQQSPASQHKPPQHDCPASQQSPLQQLFALAQQLMPQHVSPEGQQPWTSKQGSVHSPPQQICALEQASPHVPQCAGSVWTSAHVPLQQLCVPGQSTHASPAAPQAAPLVPGRQFPLWSQQPSQLPGAHGGGVVAHFPFWQTWPEAQAVAQPPQCAGSV
jgi:hypothetical protein